MDRVIPINGETLRFHVPSSSVKKETHLVDLITCECDCISWTCRRRAYKQRTGKDFECVHIRAAWEQVKQDIRKRYQ